jgi:hypothetical protein
MVRGRVSGGGQNGPEIVLNDERPSMSEGSNEISLLTKVW